MAFDGRDGRVKAWQELRQLWSDGGPQPMETVQTGLPEVGRRSHTPKGPSLLVQE